MTFRNRIEQVKLQVRLLELTVLVWGPGGKAGKDHEKRKKLKETLKTEFQNADVRFSEDLDKDVEVPGQKELTVQERELWHLAACDVCVVFDTSKGAGEEIAHFSNSNYAYKLLVLTDQKYERSTSFPAQLRKNLNQVFYTEKEYKSCNVVARAVDRVRQVGLAKLTTRFA
jgi:hypothetical protein